MAVWHLLRLCGTVIVGVFALVFMVGVVRVGWEEDRRRLLIFPGIWVALIASSVCVGWITGDWRFFRAIVLFGLGGEDHSLDF
jgi:hypothetical protein